MAGLHFDITGDNSNFMRKLDEARNGVRTTSKQIEESGVSVEQMFRRMTTAVAAFGAGFTAQQFVSQVTKVRGEFQQLEVAFNTMLGSKEKADVLMSQLVKTAAITPFDLQGVANGAKQLLAYGTAAEDVNGTLVRLGDIAAGLSIPLNDIVYLYGTTMTQGRLFTQDLRQFQGRGIPLADELAKQFGVAKDNVGELVTAGRVGFPEVQKAIESMTNEGGRFGGLMEAQSKTITGQVSNIEDAIATAFNKIGKENESIINSALSGTAYLVEHWDDVAIAIESAAIAYGTYKATVMTVAAVQGAESTLKIDAEIEGLQSLLVVKEKSKNADLEAAVASGALTEAKAVQLASLREELATRLSVLKLKEEEAIAEHTSALTTFNAAKQTSDVANDKLEKMNALYEAALAQGDASYEQYAMEQLQTASANANTASTALNTAEKNLNAVSSKRKAASEAVDTMAMQANTVANHANTASMNIMKLAGIQLTTMLKSMWATLMANPLFLVAGAVTGLAFAIYKVATAETEAEKATRMYNEALDEQQKKQDKYKENIDSLIKAIDDNNKSEGERLQAFEALKAEYPTVLNNLLTEAEYLKEIAKYKKLIAEEDNNRARQSDEEILEEAKRKLKYYQNERRNGTSTTLVDMDGNGWASDNVEDAIKAQQEIVNKAIAKVASHDVSSFLGNIKDMKDNDIVSTISGITTSLQALGKSGDDAIAIVTELGGEFSKAQLSTIKNALETEQRSRSGEKNTGKEWIEKYKNAYLAAKKELDDFLNTENELAEVEYERRLKELTDAKDEAEKKYKNVGGITGSKQENQADKLRQEQEKLNELQTKNAKDLARKLEDLYFSAEQAGIDALEDGSKKTLAQMELNHEKELFAIDREKKELIQAKVNAAKAESDAEESIKAAKNPNYKKQTFDSSGIGLSDNESISFDNKYKAALDKQAKERQAYYNAEKQSMNDYLAAYGTYIEKRNAIIAQGEERKKGENDWERKTIDEETNKALSDLDIEANKKTSAVSKLFDDMRERTVSDMHAIADEAERAFQFLQSGEWDEKNGLEFGITKETFDILRKSPEELEKIRKGIKDIRNEADQSDTAFNKMATGLKKVFSSGSDSKKLKEGLGEIENGFNDVMQVAGFLSDTLSSLGDSLGSDALNGASEGINVAMDAASSAMSGAKAGAMFGPWGAAAGAAIGLVSSLGSSLAKLHDAKHEKNIQKIQNQIEVLEKSYEKLGDSVEKAYSKDASNMINQQNKLLEQQKVLIQNQIKEEKDKKKTDWDRIKEWEGQIDEINALIEDNKEKAVDAIFGEDLKSAINNFADAYANAWTSGEDKAKSAKDVVKNMMRQMVTESIKAAIQSSKAMEDIRKKLQEFYSDNVLDEWEQNYIYDMAEKLQKELDKQFGWADGLMKDEESSTSQSSTSRGFGTEMTHEDAGELSGRFTALQVAGEEIKNAMISMLAIANTLSVSVNSNGAVLIEIKNLMITSNGYLEDIAKYTKELIGFKQTIANIENSAKSMAGK